QDEIPDVLLNHTSRVRWPDLQVITELGAGAYGTVLKAKFDGELVSVKQVRSAEMLCISQPQLFSLFLQECWAMNFLRHPKVISMIG
ncbi:hypothetical protein J0675_25465, partial [Vibrio parahaemolyticus]|nr:hypothetical protein [Vibrio parahaemolyticus]